MANKNSKTEEKNKGGRPPKFTDAEIMEQKIESYFSLCDQEKRPYTISGLALALGMDRRSLLNYSKDNKFFPTIKKAKARCENYAEESLFKPSAVAGVIFNLKNNYEDWKDKTEVDNKHSGEVIFKNDVPRPKR